MANWATTYFKIFVGASWSKGYNAGKWVQIYIILFNALLDFFFKSYELSGATYTANNLLGTSFSARCFECYGLCLPICPKLQAAAAFIWSSGSETKKSLNGFIPFAVIIFIANDSSNAAINPKVMIPGNAALPLLYDK